MTMMMNIFAGITTSLAMVPEVVAFALFAHLNPLVGLYASVILGFVATVIGSRPGLISGGAGSLAVVSVALVINHGVEYLFACIILMGLMQIGFGVLKLGKLIKYVSPAVMTGFVNGLALVIFTAQFNSFPTIGDELYVMLGLVTLTIASIIISPMFTNKIPANLISIVIVTLTVICFNIPTKTVGDIAHISGALPTFSLPNIPLTFEAFCIVLPYSFLLSIIALIETFLTAELVDKLVDEKKTLPNKEAIAQGAGNILTGLFGGMGGCAMIGQTVINVEAGGDRRLSGIVCSLAILAYIIFASVVIESIPIAALIGVMFVVCYHTFDWKSFTSDKETLIISLIVTVITVITNLAYAVIIGIILELIYNYAKQKLNDSII